MSATVGGLLATACRRYSSSTAIEAANGTRTYGELLDRSARLANALIGLGLQPGDRVAAMLEDKAESLEVYVACAMAGFPVVHVNDRLKSAEVLHIVTDSEAKGFIHTSGRSDVVPEVGDMAGVSVRLTIGDERPVGFDAYEAALEHASSEVPLDPSDPEDLAILGYTSGTTGFPKGAMISHRAIVNCIRLIPYAYRLSPQSRCAFTGSLSFVSTIWTVLLPHLYLGGKITFMGAYDPELWWKKMEIERTTFTYAPTPLVPQFVEHLPHHPAVLDSLVTVMHSASTLPPHHIRAIVDLLGDRFVEVWGMTESAGPLTGTSSIDFLPTSPASDIYASVGRALPSASVEVVDDGGNVLPRGETGELRIECDTMFSGYWRMPERTAAAVRDGRYHTGDIGHLDEAGFVYITDRANDMIISGGANVYPAEVERVIFTLDGIAECAVFGVPDAEWGEAVVAAVVVKPGVQLDESVVIEHVRQQMAGYKKPRAVHFVEALPRNASLKVQKHILQEQFGPPEESSN